MFMTANLYIYQTPSRFLEVRPRLHLGRRGHSRQGPSQRGDSRLSSLKVLNYRLMICACEYVRAIEFASVRVLMYNYNVCSRAHLGPYLNLWTNRKAAA